MKVLTDETVEICTTTAAKFSNYPFLFTSTAKKSRSKSHFANKNKASKLCNKYRVCVPVEALAMLEIN